MDKTDLHKKLYSLQDLKYRDMQIKIIPMFKRSALYIFTDIWKEE